MVCFDLQLDWCKRLQRQRKIRISLLFSIVWVCISKLGKQRDSFMFSFVNDVIGDEWWITNDDVYTMFTKMMWWGVIINHYWWWCRDDLINLADEDYFKSKSFCEDLTEGKFSYPIIHCISQNGVLDNRLLSILKQRTEDNDVKIYAQDLMKKSGSLKYTRDKCITLKKKIVAQIEELGGNPPLKKLIEQLDIQVEGLEKAVSPTSTCVHCLDSTWDLWHHSDLSTSKIKIESHERSRKSIKTMLNDVK